VSVIGKIVNFIYGTNRVVLKFKEANPDEKVIAANGVKAIKSEPKTEVDTGAHWIVSKRAVAILTDKRIKCGNWSIPLKEITSSELVNLNGLISKGQLLNVSTANNEGYQFGMQLNKDWTKSEDLKLTYIDKEIKTSTFSWLIRIGLIVYLGYQVYEKFIK